MSLRLIYEQEIRRLLIYAYHHVQNLTTNAAEFIKSVQDQGLRGNVDSPESGMDALMQAIVCEGIIRW